MKSYENFNQNIEILLLQYPFLLQMFNHRATEQQGAGRQPETEVTGCQDTGNAVQALTPHLFRCVVYLVLTPPLISVVFPVFESTYSSYIVMYDIWTIISINLCLWVNVIVSVHIWVFTILCECMYVCCILYKLYLCISVHFCVRMYLLVFGCGFHVCMRVWVWVCVM